MRLTIELPDAVADQLGSIGPDPEEVAIFAIDRVVGWFSGSERYRSLTELNTEWAAEFFSRLLGGEIPTRERLHNDFGMTYGQAGYVARVLSERNQAEWRRTAVEELFEALGPEQDEARELVASQEQLKTRMVVVSRQARRELDILLESNEVRPKIPPKNVGHVGSHVYVEITAEDIVRLIDAGH